MKTSQILSIAAVALAGAFVSVPAQAGEPHVQWLRIGVPIPVPVLPVPFVHIGAHHDHAPPAWRDRDRDGIPDWRDRHDDRRHWRGRHGHHGRHGWRADRDHDGIPDWRDRYDDRHDHRRGGRY